MDTLNPEQAAAVRHRAGPLLVLAGAGSGKTRVITHKLAHLIQECGFEARHLYAVTFTNKAAQEMKQRARQLLSGAEGRGLKVSTFHTLGLRILQREYAAIGYRKGFSVLDAQDSQRLLQELLTQLDDAPGADLAEIKQQISRWKNDGLDPKRAASRAQDDNEAAVAELFARYQAQLQAYNAFDFDDLICTPVHMFERDPAIAKRWRDRVQHLLVDEYQDTNFAQYLLLKILAHDGELTVVGDDDQSIYRWRGARVDNLSRLNIDFPNLSVIKLEQNYRSAARILASANHLIRNNPHLFEKRLWTSMGPGDRIRVVECKNAEDEAQRVVTEILAHKFQRRGRNGDYAILYRSNFQARVFEQALRHHRLPYVLSGGQSFFERTEVKDLIAYLRLLANTDDDAAFLRIVNTPKREIGPTTVERLSRYAQARGVSLVAACFELGLRSQLDARAADRLERFAQWLVDVEDRAKRGDPVTTMRALVDETGYADWLRESANDQRGAQRRLETVEEFLGWLERRQGRPDDDTAYDEVGEEVSISDLANYMTLLGILDREDDDASDSVHVMTLHAAKGLEFPYVFLAGMEEGLLPHRSSVAEADPAAIEEERRLAYVGITRAQRGLMITYARTRNRYGDLIDCDPSRFLDELPSEEIDWQRLDDERDPEERKAHGRNQLAALRAMVTPAAPEAPSSD